MSDLRIGMTLSSEERPPARLVELGAEAERPESVAGGGAA